VGVYSGDTLVSCDSRAPNWLVNQALHERTIPGLPAYSRVVPEYTCGHSRIDFCLDERILLEVKGATLVRNGQALFPDAPTERGRKHLNTLISALKNGFESYIFFLIQRPDAFSFSPNRDTDPEFADTLRHAVEKGVNVLVYTSKFEGNSLYLHENISVIDL
jgi:sugar fermentation stimulation protein A